jgi:hypothetical protein
MNADRYFLDGVCVEDSEVLKIEGRALRRVLDTNLIMGYAMQRRLSQIFFKRFVEAMERVQASAYEISLAHA